MADAPSIPGTWDDFYDCSERLEASGMSYFLASAQEGSNIMRTYSNFRTLESVAWFRKRMNEVLDEIEAGLPED